MLEPLHILHNVSLNRKDSVIEVSQSGRSSDFQNRGPNPGKTFFFKKIVKNRLRIYFC